jgi:hypothetical protein
MRFKVARILLNRSGCWAYSAFITAVVSCTGSRSSTDAAVGGIAARVILPHAAPSVNKQKGVNKNDRT